MLYDIEFEEWTVKQYAANIIAMNLLDQVSNDNCPTTSLENIVDMKRTRAKLLNGKRHAKTASVKQRQLKITDN